MDGKGKILREIRPRGKSRQITRIPKKVNRRLRTQGQFRRILPKTTTKIFEESKKDTMRSFIHSSDNAIEEAVLQAVLESSTTVRSELQSRQSFENAEHQKKLQQASHRMTQNKHHTITRSFSPVHNMEATNITLGTSQISKIQTGIILSATEVNQSRVQSKVGPIGLPKKRPNRTRPRLAQNLRTKELSRHLSKNNSNNTENIRSAETKTLSLRTRLSSFSRNKTSIVGTTIEQQSEKPVLKLNNTKVISDHRGITVKAPSAVSGEAFLSSARIAPMETNEPKLEIVESIPILIHEPVTKHPGNQETHKQLHELPSFRPPIDIFSTSTDENVDLLTEDTSLPPSSLLDTTTITPNSQSEQIVIMEGNPQGIKADSLESGIGLNTVDGPSSPAPQANITHFNQSIAAPGATPPNDFVVNELNKADDFMEVARRLRIVKRKSLRRKTRRVAQAETKMIGLKYFQNLAPTLSTLE